MRRNQRLGAEVPQFTNYTHEEVLGEETVAYGGHIINTYRIRGCGKKVANVAPGTLVYCDEDEQLSVYSMTASGKEEQELFRAFMEQVSSELAAVIEEFPSLFEPPDSEPPERTVRHRILVPAEYVPAARPAYPLSDSKKQAMRSQMQELVAKKWVVPSESLWAALILFVGKDGGKALRMCIDFHDLNALTIRDRFPLPRLDIMLQKAAQARIFSKLDLASGYHQIEVEKEHRELTAFILLEAVEGHSL